MVNRIGKALLSLLAMTFILTGCQMRVNTENQTEIGIETEVSDEQVKMYAEDTEKPEAMNQNAEIEKNGAEKGETQLEDPGKMETEEVVAVEAEATETETTAAAADVSASFYYTVLTEDIKARITGISYPDTDEPLQISYDELSYVHVLHYDFEGQVQEGELICNQAIAQDLVDIFYELYKSQYPIGKIRLIDEYGADDEASMADNNTSCFNYRPVSGTSKLSNHSYGCAIDINPLYNPYVRTRNGKELVSPDNAEPYADRSADFPYKIDREDLCCQLFTEHGFTWGGAWNSSKDYQHFEKKI